MRYWCISTSAENWEKCKRNETWGMDARYYVTLEKFVREGDKAIVYTHGGTFRALVEFIGQYFYCERNIGWTKGGKEYLFPYRIKFRIISENINPVKISFSTVDVSNKAHWSKPNFIDDIIFIADKGKTWNQYLQVSIINITEEDFYKLSEVIAKDNSGSCKPH
jgi:predicted RNA-binding protein